MSEIRHKTEFVQSDEVVACELEGGKALLDLRESRYYKLNNSAALIWEWIGNGATIDSLVDNMLEQFDVAERECRQDVTAILTSFHEAGLVETKGAQAS